MSGQRQRFAARDADWRKRVDDLLWGLTMLAIFWPWQVLGVVVSMLALAVVILVLLAWGRPQAIEVDTQALRVVRRWPLRRRTFAWSDLRRIDYEDGGLRLVQADRRVVQLGLGNFPDRAALLGAVRQHFAFDPWLPVAPLRPASRPCEWGVRHYAIRWGLLLGIVFIRWAESVLLHGLHSGNLPLLSTPSVVVFGLFLFWPPVRAWLEKSHVPLALLLLCMAVYAGNRVVTERSGQEVSAVLLVGEAGDRYQSWRVLEPPELVRDRALWVGGDWPGFDASRQAGVRYRVNVRQGWFGDVAIMPEALRAAERIGEER